MSEQARNYFNKRWTEYDPDATGMIAINDLDKLIMDLVFDELDLV